MTLKKEHLKNLKPCAEGMAWFLSQKRKKISSICRALQKENHFDWANWLLTKLMTHPQQVLYAVFCAEQVLGVFEKAVPGDDRPRKAIQVAKDFLAGKIGDASAAVDAARAARAAWVTSAAVNAARAAVDAARAAGDAARAAGDAAVNAARAAGDAARAAGDAKKRRAFEKKAIGYALNLIGASK
jgi:hypothetical protein